MVDLRLEGFRMSNSQRPETGEANSVEETGQNRESQGQNLRFTPLRSYVSRARALAKQPGGDLALSRLIPVPRLQG